jgi:hypothetical protein
MNRESIRRSIRYGLALACLIILVLALVPTQTAAAQDGQWYAEFFANQTLSGSPILTRFDDAVNFDWGAGCPGSGVPADSFSARWTRTEWFEGGTFRFYARADDGFRLWVGDLLVIDDWYDQQGGWVTRDLYLGQGAHQMRAEYYEHDGAALVQSHRLLLGVRRPGRRNPARPLFRSMDPLARVHPRHLPLSYQHRRRGPAVGRRSTARGCLVQSRTAQHPLR